MSIHAFKRESIKDRPDGKYIKDITGIQALMMNIYPNRTDSEVYLSDKIDATELMKYLEKKNAEHPDYKTTLFHCALTALTRMVKERPCLNRFIQGRRMYQRYEISLSFVAKRLFKDGASQHGLGHLAAAEAHDGPAQLLLREPKAQQGGAGHVPKGQSPLLLEPLHEPVLPINEPMALPLGRGLKAMGDLVQLLLPAEQLLVGCQHEIIQRHVLRELRKLLHTGHGALGAEGDIPGIRPDMALHHLDQGGFAASVDANETDVIPRPHLKRYIGKEDPVGELLPYLYNIQYSHTFPYAV